jgi:hypothetical protein
MKLSGSQLREFEEQGLLFLGDCFSPAEVAVLRRAATRSAAWVPTPA